MAELGPEIHAGYRVKILDQKREGVVLGLTGRENDLGQTIWQVLLDGGEIVYLPASDLDPIYISALEKLHDATIVFLFEVGEAIGITRFANWLARCVDRFGVKDGPKPPNSGA